MYGEPREGTEAYLVKQEAERRKKLAKDKGLDQLLLDTYDDLKHYPSWIKDEKNKRWIHQSISEAKYVGEKYDYNIEFKFGDKVYKIIRKRGYSPEFWEGIWYDLMLSLNEKKIFEITEEETSDQYSTYHRPISVNAYVNDDWAEDFKSINAHRKNMSKEAELEYAEDPKRTQALKDNFGITALPKVPIIFNTKPALKIDQSIWSKWWVWALIIGLLVLLGQ